MSRNERFLQRKKLREDQDRDSRRAILAAGLGLPSLAYFFHTIGETVRSPSVRVANATTIPENGRVPMDLNPPITSRKTLASFAVTGTPVLIGMGQLDVTTSLWRVPQFDENGDFKGSRGERRDNVVTVVNPIATIGPSVTRRRLFSPQESMRNSHYWFLDPEAPSGSELCFVTYDRLATYWKQPPTFVYGYVDSFASGPKGESPKVIVRSIDDQLTSAAQVTDIREYFDKTQIFKA